MDFERLWDKILCVAESQPFNVVTTPQNNRKPRWYKVCKKEGYLYVDNTVDKTPSVKLRQARKITKKDFLNIAVFYENWKNGEPYLRQEVRNHSMNSTYIFGLISHFSNL